MVIVSVYKHFSLAAFEWREDGSLRLFEPGILKLSNPARSRNLFLKGMTLAIEADSWRRSREGDDGVEKVSLFFILVT